MSARVPGLLGPLVGEAAPAPRAAFVDSLERRLCALERPTDDPLVIAEPVRPRALRRVSGGAAVALLALVVLAVGLAPAPPTRLAARPPLGAGASDQAVDESAERPQPKAVAPAAAGEFDESRHEPPPLSHASDGAIGRAEQREPAPVVSDERDVETLTLRASGTPLRVQLRWGAYRGADFDRYVVLRTDDGSEPEAGRTAAFAMFYDRFTVSMRDESPPPGSVVRYRVVALDATGGVVAASEVAEPQLTGEVRRLGAAIS